MKKSLLFILKVFIASLFFMSYLWESIFGNKSISITTISNVLFGCILSILIIKNVNHDEKPHKWMVINAFLFSVFIEIGICIFEGGSLSYFWANFKHVIKGVFNVVAFTFFLAYLLLFLNKIIRILKEKKIKNKLILFLFYKHPFISTFIITLSLSGFYLVFFYPGTTCIDGTVELAFYYGQITFTNHHPALLTLIMGHLMDLGRMLGSDNLGIFFFIFPQVVINALVYAYVLFIMNKMNTPFFIRLLAFVFYSLSPMLVINSITYYKDTLFYLIFLFLFVYTYYHFKVDYHEGDKKKYLVLAGLYLALYLTRNTGFYIVFVVTLVFLISFYRKNKRVAFCFLILFVFNIGVNSLYHSVFLPTFQIKEGSVREMMSIPLQQTGRYLKYYLDDLTDEEQSILTELFKTDLKSIGEAYDPYISDGVKSKFKEYLSKQELIKYFKVWLTCFKKHPLLYVDATLNNTYGYFYPNFLNLTNVSEEVGYFNLYNTVEDLYFQFNDLSEGRAFLYWFANLFIKIPGLSLLYMPGIYTWLLISSCFYLITRKRKNELIYFTSLFMVLFFCLVSPVNGHMRYIMPIVVSIPFVLAILTKKSINLH